MSIFKYLMQPLRQEPNAPDGPIQLLFGFLWRTRLGRAVLFAIAIIALFGVLHDPIRDLVALFQLKDGQKMPSQPRVVIMTPTEPSDHFALLHLNGLRLGLDHTRLGPPLEIGGTADDYKAGKIDDQIKLLKRHLDRKDVVAVVAPSITEATAGVLEAISSCGDPIPVFLESSIPWDDVGVYRDTMNLFRLSSGIGERGSEVARIAQRLKNRGLNVWFVAETVKGEISYGERLLNHALRGPGKAAVPGNQRVRFRRGDSVDTPESPVRDLPFSDPQAVIFVFALGDDFSSILTSYYKRSDAPKARIVGVMTAYKLEATVTEELAYDLVYDISDLDTRPGLAKDDEAGAFYDAYALKYGVPNPTHRDQAFSFDVALVLNRAFTEDLLRLRYRKGLGEFSKQIAEVDVTGVTGHVRFLNPRPDFKTFYQNDQSDIRIVQYDPTRSDGDRWHDVAWQAWVP